MSSTTGSSTSTPIYIADALKTVILLAEASTNYLSDGDTTVLGDAAQDEPKAAVFSMGDLTISGDGSLAVEGNTNDGIASKDGLIIAGGTIRVTAVDDGVRGKDLLKSDNDEDAAKGYVLIEDGALGITAGGDAITAQTDVLIAGGDISLLSGGGGSGRIDASASAKGIKGIASVVIDGGRLAQDSFTVSGDYYLYVNGSTIALDAGRDGLDINGSVVMTHGVLF